MALIHTHPKYTKLLSTRNLDMDENGQTTKPQKRNWGQRLDIQFSLPLSLREEKRRIFPYHWPLLFGMVMVLLVLLVLVLLIVVQILHRPRIVKVRPALTHTSTQLERIKISKVRISVGKRVRVRNRLQCQVPLIVVIIAVTQIVKSIDPERHFGTVIRAVYLFKQ